MRTKEKQRVTRVRRLHLFVCFAFLLLAVVPAWGDPGRAISGDDGFLHRVSINSSGYISIDVGQPYGGYFPSSLVPDTYQTFTSPYHMCRTTIQVPGPGEGLAEFDAKIYYAYVADTPVNASDESACTSGRYGLSVWVAVFSEKDGKWLSNRALGPVRTDNLGRGSGAGAAIAVFDSKLYVFTNKQTYSSTDGFGWTATDPPVYNNINYEPLDAITIYPPVVGSGSGAPKVLLVYGEQSATGNTYSSLLGGVWDGNPAHGLADVQLISSSPSFGRASLIMGTATSMELLQAGYGDWGMKAPVVQLFANAKPASSTNAAKTIKHWEYHYYNYWGEWEGTWRYDPLGGYPASARTVDQLLVFPEYFTECFESNDAFAPYQDLRQNITVNWLDNGSRRYMSFRSDALVPQNKDPNTDLPMTRCGEFGGTSTDTTTGDPDVFRVRQHYWTLVGVILGSPPFALNGYTATADLSPFSNVIYGVDESRAVDHGHSMNNALMLSVGGEVRAGVKGVVAAKLSFDLGYKHSWMHNFGDVSSQTVKEAHTFGTSQSAYSEHGKWGWALFNAPTLVLQNWKAYAYNYDASTGVGVDLNQTLHTIRENGVAVKLANFELENPGGPNDRYPGLMAGIGPFGCSRSLYDWYRFPAGVYSWENDPRWDTKLGENNVINPDQSTWPTQGQYLKTKIQPLEFVPGAGTENSYAQSDQHYDTRGDTKEISITEGGSISVGTAVNGFTFNEKGGYAGSFGWSTKTTTGFGSQLSFTLRMKPCNVPGAGCLSSLSVQPYWLLAKNGDAGAGAPWIPPAFSNDRPWAITWKASGATPIPTSSFTCGPATTSTLISSSLVGSSYADDSRAGTAPPPAKAFGRIVSGDGGDEPGEQYSHYVIEGGRLTWVETGTEERIPMTADDFDPAQGVAFEVQDFSWSSSSGNGAWSRSGDIWIFKPNGRVRENRVTLKLDFGAAAYDLHIEKADLSGRVPAGSTIVNLILTVNQRYAFFTPLSHNVDIAWRWSASAPDSDKAHVTSFQGRYDTATQSGKVSIAGTLPATLPAFGDLSVDVNGHPYLARLIDLDGFQEAFENGDAIKYAKKGVIIVVDFGEKTWSATFNGEAFHELIVPQMGRFRANISVGGAPWGKLEDAVWDYSANLALRE